MSSDQAVLDFSNIGRLYSLPKDEAWTAAELSTAISIRQEEFQEQGVTHTSRVMIAHGGTPAFFADLLAVWSLGACAVCLNAKLTQNELDTLIGFVKPALVVKEPISRPTQPGKKGILTIAQPADREALILFTSGTTGDPKGVVHTFGSLSTRIALNCEHIDQQNLARTLCVLPTHFGHGLIGNCLTPMAAGSDLLLMPSPNIQQMMALGNLLDDQAITFMSSVPSFWKIALKGSPPAKHTLKQVGIGSAPLAGELVDQVAQWTGCPDVRNMYGITETANWIAGASTLDGPLSDGLVGKPWGGEAAVLRADGMQAPTGDGEILVRSRALMSGYLDRTDLTTAVLNDGWFHTGDKGTIDAGGRITLTGRLKSEINRAGMKISPEEIDLLLERREDVLEACAFGIEDSIAGEIIGIALALKGGSIFSERDFRTWCTERIRAECIPERWFVLPEIPKTDRGKLNRDMVRAKCLQREVS